MNDLRSTKWCTSEIFYKVLRKSTKGNLYATLKKQHETKSMYSLFPWSLIRNLSLRTIQLYWKIKIFWEDSVLILRRMLYSEENIIFLMRGRKISLKWRSNGHHMTEAEIEVCGVLNNNDRKRHQHSNKHFFLSIEHRTRNHFGSIIHYIWPLGGRQ